VVARAGQGFTAYWGTLWRRWPDHDRVVVGARGGGVWLRARREERARGGSCMGVCMGARRMDWGRMHMCAVRTVGLLAALDTVRRWL
jgi:hypothetical protein